MKLTIREDSINYAATIVSIDNLHPIPDKDMIQRTVIHGNNVIVSKSVKVGDIMVYFCSGTRLSEGYCYHNNLYTDKEKNIDVNAKPGYISPKQRRVKALKLAGVISDGFLMPVSSLDFMLRVEDISPQGRVTAQWSTLLDGSAFKVGDTFTTINGADICEKYIVQVRNSNPGGKAPARNKLEGVILDNQLRFHPDTEHFAKNLHKFSENSKIVITRKLHGCLPFNQPIKMFNGSNKKISSVTIGDEVLGFNHKSSSFERAVVTKVFENGYSDKWLSIKKEISGTRLGEFKEKLICTPEHRIYVKDKGYIKASEVRVGDKVISFVNSFVVPKEAEEFIIGKVIGDGSLAKKQGKRRTLAISHKIDHKDYLYHCRNVVDIWTETADERMSGYGTRMIRSISRENSYFTNLSKRFLKDGKRIFPKDLKLTPIILAYWYMDDGNLTHHKSQKDRAAIAICGFVDDESVENIREALLDFGFNNFTLFKDPKGYNRLRFNHSDALKLFETIHQYVPSCMRYKLPEEYRNREQNILSGFKITEAIVEEEGVISEIGEFVKNKKFSNKKYDIETTLNNYISGGILVHNSSFLGGHILVHKPLGLKGRIAKFFGVNVQETEYGYVWSSGKPKSRLPKGIESNSHQWDTPNQSFYKENIWEKMYHRIKDFIEPGVTIYGELVGCFHYRTPILLSDGSTKEIGAIVTSKSSVEVLTYNIDRQVLEPKKVVAWYENGPTDDWYIVETKRRKRGGKSNKLTVTSNHKFFTEECGNIVEKPLSELNVGDVVYTQGRTLNRNQLEYIKGSLLGDGCFSDRRHYVTSHSNNSQQFYNDFISTFLEGTVRSSISDKGSDMSVFSSIAYPEIEELYEELYSNKKSKEPTRKYLESLSNISLAAWYMDDGSFTEVKNERQFVCHLHTLGFTKESNEIICEFFNSRGYECHISKREKYYSDTKYCIQFTPKGAASFLFDISPYILKGFDYKIPTSFRDIPKINICTPIYEYDKSLLKTYITSIKRGIHYENKDPRRFDIKVEGNSNYFANNILVHNSGIQGTEYTYGHELELYVYRITVTSPVGHVYEMSWDHVKDYCNKYDLKYVTEYFDGKVGDLVQIAEELLEYLSEKYLNKSYPDCKIDEGICIRLGDEIFKLKSPKFILMESDLQEKEITNIEDDSN